MQVTIVLDDNDGGAFDDADVQAFCRDFGLTDPRMSAHDEFTAECETIDNRWHDHEDEGHYWVDAHVNGKPFSVSMEVEEAY